MSLYFLLNVLLTCLFSRDTYRIDIIAMDWFKTRFVLHYICPFIGRFSQHESCRSPPSAFSPGFEGERKMRIYYQRGRWSVLQAKVYSTKREGPMDAKDLDWAREVLMRKRTGPADQRIEDGSDREARIMRLQRYFGPRPSWALRTKIRTLNCMRPERGSQCSCSATNIEMWENRGSRAINSTSVK